MESRQQPVTLSIKEFAERIGEKPSRIYYRIRTNKGDIRAYYDGKRINYTIFETEPYKTLSERQEAHQEATPPASDSIIADLRADLEETKRQLADAQAENRLQAQTIAHQEQTINLLQSELDTAHRLHAMTLAALPAPRKTFGEKIREALHIKPKQEDA